MTYHTTIFLTTPGPALLSEVRRRRPDWLVHTLEENPPDSLPPGPVWIFVDWLGEAMSGLELCRRLRDAGSTSHAHITMVLDSPDREAKRRAVQAGADDYLIGPLTFEDLATRIGDSCGPLAPVRRVLVHGPVSLDPAAHQVRIAGRPVPLRPNEFRLLAHFMEHPDQVFSRTALIDRLGKDEEAIDERTVDVWVGRLRRALAAQGAPDPLRTVRALGYVMDSPAPD